MNLLNTFSSAGNQIVKTTAAAGQSVVDAGSDFIDQQTAGLAKAEDAFKNDSVAGGMTELMDALSPGTAGANALASLGLIPTDGPGKELVSAALNMTNAAFLPAAVKDLGDAFGQLGGTGTPPRGQVATPHSPPAPKAQYDIACQGPRRPQGFFEIAIKFDIGLSRTLQPGMDLAMIAMCPASALMIGPMRLFQKQFQDLILKAIDHGCKSPDGKGGIKRPEQPLAERKDPENASIEDILGDKSLCFEDMLFLVMMKVTKDMQAEMREEVAKMDAIDKQIKGGGAESAEGTEGAQGGSDQAGQATGTKAENGNQFIDKAAEPDFFGSLVGGLLGGGKGGAGGGLPLGEIGGLLDMAKPFLPMIAPLVGSACAAIPYVGPFLSAAMPIILPMAVDLVGNGLKAADGPVNSAIGGLAQSAQQGGGSKQAGGSGGAFPMFPMPNKSGGGAPASSGAAKQGAQGTEKPQSKEELKDSRSNQMEKIKMMQQKLTEMQQALSNIMNAFHKTSMNTISNIR